MSGITPSTISDTLARLAHSQNADGGWGYQRTGGSWTEATAFALLALQPHSETWKEPSAKGLRWMESLRRADGGWSPHPNVRESTWVTSLALLVLGQYGLLGRQDPGIAWMNRAEGAESSWSNRLRRWLLGGNTQEVQFDGWPWYPGAASWVGSTALGILAAAKLVSLRPTMPFPRRIESAKKFLIARRCADHGWNHGSSKALGYNGDSYSETTGMALLALQGSDKELMRPSCEKAEDLLRICKSLEGWCWLQMGLHAHGRTPPLGNQLEWTPRDAREMALLVITLSSLQGQSPWSSA